MHKGENGSESVKDDIIDEDPGGHAFHEENVLDLSIDSSSLKDVDMIRKSFEQGSMDSPASFTFGDAFHKRQSQFLLGERRALREAKDSMRGVSKELLTPQKKTQGEIDSSPLAKTFTFEGQPRDDGVSQDKSDETQLIDSKYKAAVFVVHQTHGMLFLRRRNHASPIDICGGSIGDIEISRAALKSSHYKMQLQIAAREAACRHLYEQTGMDVRCDLERLQPAVLYLEPPLGSDGIRLLRNELHDGLYYFFRVSSADLVNIPNVEYNGAGAQEPLEGGRLNEATDLNSFVFVNEPTKALELLENNGGPDSAFALQMVIEESRATPKGDLNDTCMQETELLAGSLGESKQKSRLRQKFSGMQFLRSTMLCFRKR